MGFDVLLLGAKRKNSPRLVEQKYKTDRVSLFFQRGKLFYLEFNLKIFFYLLFTKTDIITANDLDTLLPSYIVSRIKRCPLVYDTHEYFTEMPELENRPKTKKIWLVLERLIFPKLNYIITVNQSIANIYSNKYGKSVKVVRNLPLRIKDIPTFEKKQNIIIYQGNVNKGRGIDVTLEALKYLEGVEFWCVGPGDLLDDMKKLACKLGVEHKAKFWGPVPFQELYKYTMQAKIGISIEQPVGLNSTLCLPNKLLDYIQCHLPVIVSDLPEMRKIVEEHQVGLILKNPKSAYELASHIKRLCEDSDLWLFYSKNSAKAAEILCWENEKHVLKEIYEAFV
jgi:glycosyltransferase involved in cell wall biosynthesis